MKVKTHSDMGAIKLFNKGLSCFFANGYGDGENTVEVCLSKKGKSTQKMEFLGHFTVKEGEVYLSEYDCSDDPAYTFYETGRYFVYLRKSGSLYIERIDNETHS